MLEIIVLGLCVLAVIIHDRFDTPKPPAAKPSPPKKQITLGDLFEQAKANNRRKDLSTN